MEARRPNLYSGRCSCGNRVGSGRGFVQRVGERWIITCEFGKCRNAKKLRRKKSAAGR